ncbi:hypothetical protein AB0M80_44025 [Amycolatopsis sp. NPDC051045]|uniref:hypothetical protein n=1 Tax=Amycolatopsis sp. NPDC051045 TaxID=3156922 RepID=UPI003436EC0E
MQGRRARADGTPDDDANAALTTPNQDRDLAELEADDDGIQRAAEFLERRRHDLALRNELAAENFDGPVWDRFVEELARYGHAVMLAWLRTGEIFAHCSRTDRPIGAVPLTWSDEDRIDLATDAVVSAIKTFRKNALVGGGWTPEGGASLRTYFIGACVLVFPAIYRSWKTQHEKQRRCPAVGTSSDLEDVGTVLAQRANEPDDVAIVWRQIADGLQALPDDRTRTALAASTMGYTYVEIADLLSVDTEVSRGTVAQILLRHRRRLENGASA